MVIPAVGVGKRFVDAGYGEPKPLIKVNGVPIIQHAIESLQIDGTYIFVVRKNDNSEELRSIIADSVGNLSYTIVEAPKVTDGPVNSVLLAEGLIDNESELVVANCDQRTDWDATAFIEYCRSVDYDGVVTTYPFDDIIEGQKSPYSFIKIGASGSAVALEEKFAISNLALCGIHYWKHGNDFVRSAKSLIAHNDRTNNEFYVSKTYNYLIEEGKRIINFPLSSGQFHSLGTPKDVELYLSSLLNANEDV